MSEEFLWKRLEGGVAALTEAIDGGRSAVAIVTIPIFLDKLRWEIVDALDSRDELYHQAIRERDEALAKLADSEEAGDER